MTKTFTKKVSLSVVLAALALSVASAQTATSMESCKALLVIGSSSSESTCSGGDDSYLHAFPIAATATSDAGSLDCHGWSNYVAGSAGAEGGVQTSSANNIRCAPDGRGFLYTQFADNSSCEGTGVPKSYLLDSCDGQLGTTSANPFVSYDTAIDTSCCNSDGTVNTACFFFESTTEVAATTGQATMYGNPNAMMNTASIYFNGKLCTDDVNAYITEIPELAQLPGQSTSDDGTKPSETEELLEIEAVVAVAVAGQMGPPPTDADGNILPPPGMGADTGAGADSSTTGACSGAGGTKGSLVNSHSVVEDTSSGKRIITSNNIPAHGVDAADPNEICEQTIRIELPLRPVKSATTTAVPTRGAIGVATNGVLMFGPQEMEGTNAVEGGGQIQVDCKGHPSPTGQFHYHHSQLMCTASYNQETLLGWALDGFSIYGPLNTNKVGADAQLDACNGRTVNGVYQYHVRTLDQVDETLPYDADVAAGTNNWKYYLGCFHGTEIVTSLNTPATTTSSTTGTASSSTTTGTTANVDSNVSGTTDLNTEAGSMNNILTNLGDFDANNAKDSAAVGMVVPGTAVTLVLSTVVAVITMFAL